MNGHVIIGNSASAVGAVESIRRVDRSIPITMISDEPQSVYSRPLISYFLSGELKSDQMYYRPKDFYEKNRARALLGSRVTKVNFEKKSVQLENREKIPYDRLLITTGGKPFIPRMEGIDTSGVFTFTKWEDAQKILSALKKVQKAVVIGGGLIGLKAVEALRERKIEVMVVELADHILSMVMDSTASSILEGVLKKEGVDLFTSNTVKAILGNGRVESVRLADGKKLKTQMVIVAIGVVPNVELFRGTSLHIEKGIVVNERTETNLPDVFAAGDVAEGVDSITGRPQLNATWLNAIRQGWVAGLNMAGKKISYLSNVRVNITNLFGLPFASVGLIRGEGRHHQEVTLRNGNHYRKFVFKDNLLVGTVLIGDVSDVGFLTSLIERRELFPELRQELQKNPYSRGLLSIRRKLLCQR